MTSSASSSRRAIAPRCARLQLTTRALRALVMLAILFIVVIITLLLMTLVVLELALTTRR